MPFSAIVVCFLDCLNNVINIIPGGNYTLNMTASECQKWTIKATDENAYLILSTLFEHRSGNPAVFTTIDSNRWYKT